MLLHDLDNFAVTPGMFTIKNMVSSQNKDNAFPTFWSQWLVRLVEATDH